MTEPYKIVLLTDKIDEIGQKLEEKELEQKVRSHVENHLENHLEEYDTEKETINQIFTNNYNVSKSGQVEVHVNKYMDETTINQIVVDKKGWDKIMK